MGRGMKITIDTDNFNGFSFNGDELTITQVSAEVIIDSCDCLDVQELLQAIADLKGVEYIEGFLGENHE